MPRLLLVEDDVAFRTTLAAWLARAGYELELAANGAEAIAWLRQARFDVVVTDLAMPHMSGLELLEQMQTEGVSASVVFLTGQATVEIAIAALREGRAFDFVLKPLRDLSAFRTILERAVTRSFEAQPFAQQATEHPILPARDLEILGLAGRGLDNHAIALQLGLSERTIRNRLSALYARLGVENRTQAILWALAAGLVGPA